jgi:hypothetical protein
MACQSRSSQNISYIRTVFLLTHPVCWTSLSSGWWMLNPALTYIPLLEYCPFSALNCFISSHSLLFILYFLHSLWVLSKNSKIVSTQKQKKTNSVALSPRTNYTDWSTATCRRNLVSTFVDRGVSRGQRGGSPTVVNLSFLNRSRYFSFK